MAARSAPNSSIQFSSNRVITMTMRTSSGRTKPKRDQNIRNYMDEALTPGWTSFQEPLVVQPAAGYRADSKRTG
jgi:hypothetical protein